MRGVQQLGQLADRARLAARRPPRARGRSPRARGGRGARAARAARPDRRGSLRGATRRPAPRRRRRTPRAARCSPSSRARGARRSRRSRSASRPAPAARAPRRGSGSRCTSRARRAPHRLASWSSRPVLRAHPLVLHARAQARELHAVAGSFPCRSDRIRAPAAPGTAPRQRRRGGQPRAARHVAADLERRAGSGVPGLASSATAPRTKARQPSAGARGARAGSCRARRGRRRTPRRRLAARPGSRADGADRDPLRDRERQREAIVVVGVLADQVDAPGGEGGDAPIGHARSPRAALPPPPRAARRR